MKTFVVALKIFLFFTVLTGLLYPLMVTGIAQLVYPSKANGSMVSVNGKTLGSALIGQACDTAIYFSPRPSAIAYNPLPSGGSNYGLTNQKLKDLVATRRKQFIAYNQLDSLVTIPSEMLFASASGLDPDISQEAAMLQVKRIAAARHFNASQQQKLVQCIFQSTEDPQFLFLGERRVNVFLLNLSIDCIK